MNPDRLVCGLAASLRDWRAEQFRRFLAWHDGGRDGEPLLPLRLDHEVLRWPGYEPGSGDIGSCLQFASVPADPPFPGGLLVLGELGPACAPQILADMRNREQWLAMSLRGVTHGDDLWVAEVSLVDKVGQQRDEGALVIAAGAEAVGVWDLLAGRRTRRAVRGHPVLAGAPPASRAEQTP